MKERHDRPLTDGETELITIGCRHSNPDICAKHSMPDVCAFVTKDCKCYSPPASWKKLYARLKSSKES
jgi:hypothetical protein